MSPTRVIAGVIVLCLAIASPVHAGPDDANPEIPPATVPGDRVAEYRDSSGGVGRITDFAEGSMFASYGGGAAAPCNYQYVGPDPDGDGPERGPVLVGQSLRWKFTEVAVLWSPDLGSQIELVFNSLPFFGDVDLSAYYVPISEGYRRFNVACVGFLNGTDGPIVTDGSQYTYIDVPLDDPTLDPHWIAARLRNDLQLIRPVVFRNEVVNRWNGLVVRHPAWLGISDDAWVRQRSNVERWRGWELDLLASPVELEFIVNFVPKDPDGQAFSVVVECVQPGSDRRGGAGVFPEVPWDLPEWADPGVGENCEWTPPAKGEVTITAQITFDITFRMSGYLETLAPYVWQSAPVTYTVGELRAVNVNE